MEDAAYDVLYDELVALRRSIPSSSSRRRHGGWWPLGQVQKVSTWADGFARR
jgi:hypothetical protein